jgi:ParB-like chromosome segregation protein Spo0J
MAASYEMHELCTAFPLMKNDQFMALVKDIRENGLLEPITLYKGKILDGRNRYTACVNAMIEPVFEEYDGDDPLAFVISRNLSRRHLDESQRAMVAAKLANMKEGRPSETLQICRVSQSAAAEKLNVSTRSVADAKAVLKNKEKSPELIEAVEQGEIPVSVAADVAKLPEEVQHQIIGSDDRKAAAKRLIAEHKKTQKPDDPDERQLKALHKAWDAADSDARARFLENIGVTSFVGIEL